MRAAVLAGALLLAGCVTESGPYQPGFPLYLLGSVDVPGGEIHCAFLGGSGDGVAGAAGNLYFIDYAQGYLRAEVPVGGPISDVASTADGGYAAAAASDSLHYVSDQTYLAHDPLPVGGTAAFLFSTWSTMYVLRTDGKVLSVDVTTSPWSVGGEQETGVAGVKAAAFDPDHSSLFVASSSTLYKLSVPSFEVLAQNDISLEAIDLCAPGNDRVYLMPEGSNRIWEMSAGTCAKLSELPLPGVGTSLGAMPSGSHVYAGCEGRGLLVLESSTGTVVGQYGGISAPGDVSVSTDGARALIGLPYDCKVQMLN